MEILILSKQYHLLSGILRYKDQHAPNFLDQKDGTFKKLQGTMNTHQGLFQDFAPGGGGKCLAPKY